mmetsp:Transcript_33387/g.72733  ORF Transcript_33387/g.72733 Transcript_33387/m.72733 type:complete len:160 (-) Transcript_33387:67-546(-)
METIRCESPSSRYFDDGIQSLSYIGSRFPGFSAMDVCRRPIDQQQGIAMRPDTKNMDLSTRMAVPALYSATGRLRRPTSGRSDTTQQKGTATRLAAVTPGPMPSAVIVDLSGLVRSKEEKAFHSDFTGHTAEFLGHSAPHRAGTGRSRRLRRPRNATAF